MAKITERQRQYFIDRVHEETDKEIKALNLKYASTIEATTSKNFGKFIKDLGCEKLYKDTKKAEALLTENKIQLSGIINRNRTKEQNNHHMTSIHEWSSWKDFNNALRQMAGNCAKDLFEDTPGGKRIKMLKDKRKAAVDHIYGMNNNNEIIAGVNHILKGTNVKLLGE